jgi:hypothetical protein
MAVGVAAAAAKSLSTRARALYPHLFGIGVSREMHVLDDGVGLENHPSVRNAQIHQGTIISRTRHHGGVGWQVGGQAGDQLELVHASVLATESNSQAKFKPLKMAWLRMDAVRSPVRS